MLDALKKYAVFEGRARRKEYWLFILLFMICYTIGLLIDATAATPGIFSSLVTLGLLVPAIAVGVRRLHDIDKSGWFYIASVIPLLNIVLLVFMCFEGTKGPNRFGEDPKEQSEEKKSSKKDKNEKEDVEDEENEEEEDDDDDDD